MLVLALLAKRNTAILVSGFPIDIYNAYGIINPTDTGIKGVQNRQCRIVSVQNTQWFFPIFTGYLSFLKYFLILCDFTRL